MSLFKHIDWILFAATVPILGAGLMTMHSFMGDGAYYFNRQILWIIISISVFFVFSFIDWRFLKRTDVLVALFIGGCALLISLFFFGTTVKGAERWLSIGGFSFQPSDPVKLILILILAKYFSVRHVEIAHIRHILVSGCYAFLPFALIFLQPDLGSAVIIFLLWFGMIVISGVSKKHLAFVGIAGLLSFGLLWGFVFEDYQKQRIATFIDPLTDVQGAGYNAMQSTIAVGSGELFGRGVGFGTQSRLQFLPEHQTDFIFASFAEEWGFIGVLILFTLFGIVIWRILHNAVLGATNFETLFGVGVALFFMVHITINVGMNVGLLPVTGTPLPFMSYGGSHLLTEFAALGILMGMRRYARTTHRENMSNEIVGVT